MSDVERRFRRLALRACAVLGLFAGISVLSPLALAAAAAVAPAPAQQAGCSVTCPDGSWCWVQGTAPCSCTCPPGGGAYCACQDIVVWVAPARAQ